MIRNITKRKTIILQHKIADNAFSRALGLMFSRKKDFDYGLVFDLKRETRTGASIHMFFVFFPINLVFLNKQKRVVDIKMGLRPWQMMTPKTKCRYIIELPIKYNRKLFSLGDRISW